MRLGAEHINGAGESYEEGRRKFVGIDNAARPGPACGSAIIVAVPGRHKCMSLVIMGRSNQSFGAKSIKAPFPLALSLFGQAPCRRLAATSRRGVQLFPPPAVPSAKRELVIRSLSKPVCDGVPMTTQRKPPAVPIRVTRPGEGLAGRLHRSFGTNPPLQSREPPLQLWGRSLAAFPVHWTRFCPNAPLLDSFCCLRATSRPVDA
jgi:hypothetical protein